ncbi:hypothetical protein QWZ08_03020 [Ferruginibacter paludis]|uniref:hypothetical protein n=1 Tax=Ferruginibacter paludis TaxID=1310417 RepID=UPI0025B57C7B|nr:hypothetical protein [Ferruginibacter paludis]MDN3654581.1 hypothetical protein [Ferruginibacter paludis]
MKTPIILTALFTILTNALAAQQVIIKGTLRCINNGVTSTRGATNIIIIPSFNPKAAVATTTTPQGYFEINTGWSAKDLRDKNVSLYIITKCSSCKKVERVFISEDLDKRNPDPSKMFVTIKNWKILENCKESELPDIMSEKLLDSAHHLPALTIDGSAQGSAAMGPVSFINLFEKLITVAASQKAGFYKAATLLPGKIKYGEFLHSSPLINTDNTGFNFAPSRNLSEAVFWNAAAIANSSKPNNVSLLANFKNNIKLSGYQQIAPKLYLGMGGIYTQQNEFRNVISQRLGSVASDFDTVNRTHTQKLKEFAAFIAPVYSVNNKLSVALTLKSVWQQFNNPNLIVLQSDFVNNVDYVFFVDDSIRKQHFDFDASVNYKINSYLQAGVSVMNIAGNKLYKDLFIKDSSNQSFVNQRAYGIGICYKRERLNVGVDALFTDKGLYDAAIGVNYVPANNILLATGYAIKQQSFSASFRWKHFKLAYINDNNLMINEVRLAKNKLFNGKIYSGFVFDF